MNAGVWLVAPFEAIAIYDVVILSGLGRKDLA